MVGDAEFQADDGGDARTGPQLSTKAIGCGSTLQQLGQAGELCGREPARGPGRGMVAQGVGALLAGALHPLTDGAFTDAERFSDLALGPAPLLETPGLAPSGFFPVGRYWVHAWESTINSLGL
jgi:hypothetical protein